MDFSDAPSRVPPEGQSLSDLLKAVAPVAKWADPYDGEQFADWDDDAVTACGLKLGRLRRIRAAYAEIHAEMLSQPSLNGRRHNARDGSSPS